MIRINERVISEFEPPFIVAEISSNHNQSLESAMKIVEAAAKTGVDAIKLQTATVEGLTLDCDMPDFKISDPKSLWFGQSLHELYKKAITPWEWHERIFSRCKELKLLCFSSPFEEKAVDFLEKLDAPCYKIASFEIVDLKLVARVAKTGKPIIISTGLATLSEIESAVATCQSHGNNQIVLLKCTSAYPASPKAANVMTIPHLKEAFKTQVGISDHTQGLGVCCAAVALGATFIEKHFILDRTEGGLDSAFSLEPKEFEQLVVESNRAWLARGEVSYGAGLDEKNSHQFRRSIYVVNDIIEGERITESNVKIIRPGYGLHPSYINLILGMKVNRNLKKGTAMSWSYVG